MYYESYRRPKRRRRRKSCLGALIGFALKLTAAALVLALLACAVLYVLPVASVVVEREPGELSVNGELPADPFNVLLLGVDVLNDGYQRSDTMMIASVDREAVRLTSLQRDMLAAIEGHGTAKLNAAFAYGGAELAMSTVNAAFDLNLARYVIVDFTAVVRLVDALGGIEVDITEAEMRQINLNVVDSGRVFAPLGYVPSELTEYGENTHLDGLQALGYSRIRRLDSDFMRTSRQRTVIEAMLKKLRSNVMNPLVTVSFVRTALQSIETNMTAPELISLGMKVVFAREFDQLRLPADGTFDDDGSSLTVTDRNGNIRKFREFVYGE